MSVKSGDVFHNPTTSIPTSDPKIHRIDFDTEETGARASHIKGLHSKNQNAISHIKSK
jgi:hypothetical protein